LCQGGAASADLGDDVFGFGPELGHLNRFQGLERAELQICGRLVRRQGTKAGRYDRPVAWVRRVRTASGATAVQIAESVAGRRRIVRHVGSARDEAELGLLIEEANRLLADDRQGVLDLGITPAVAKAVLLPPSTQPGLFAGTATPLPSRQMVPRPRVLKSSSGLLYDALAGVYSSLGFDVVDDEVFRDLVIARVVEPTSLLDVDRVLAEMGRASASLSTRKRTLRRAQEGTYRDQIATACFNHVLSSGDVSLVLYDVTTLYFEADKEDELRKVGYSNYAEVSVMPRSSSQRRCSCWSAGLAGVARAA